MENWEICMVLGPHIGGAGGHNVYYEVKVESQVRALKALVLGQEAPPLLWKVMVLKTVMVPEMVM